MLFFILKIIAIVFIADIGLFALFGGSPILWSVRALRNRSNAPKVLTPAEMELRDRQLEAADAEADAEIQRAMNGEPLKFQKK